MDLIELFRALGDPVRFRIVQALFDRPRNVSDLVEIVGASQPNVSRHLKALRDCEVIRPSRKGKWIEYSLNDEALRAMREWLSDSAVPTPRRRKAGAGVGGRTEAVAEVEAEPERVVGDDAFLFGE